MNVKYFTLGKYVIYTFKEDEESKALFLVKELGLSFYPRATIENKYISREVFSNYMLSKLKIKEDCIITVPKDLFDKLDLSEMEIACMSDLKPSKTTLKENVSLIKNAKTVFVGGRGLGSKSNYERLKKLAKKYGAECGCTRPVAMNGWESYDNFVGISGHILESEVVVTFGVSGAGPLIKGIEKAKRIIAINNDKDALIFSHADYGIVLDVMEAIKYLEENDIR